ncbi:hypothetical protein [Pseudomonas citri]|uniref:hypothetical protein n=1 Tax=Pseudomonas citri TaxID=2978349 RepID=UPI0021B5F05B|nr:hypothetical protein [Pseudomonas citri]
MIEWVLCFLISRVRFGGVSKLYVYVGLYPVAVIENSFACFSLPGKLSLFEMLLFYQGIKLLFMSGRRFFIRRAGAGTEKRGDVSGGPGGYARAAALCS